MSRNSAPGGMAPDIKASNAGERRRRADYLVLVYLGEVEEASIEDIERAIKNIEEQLSEKGFSIPIYFESGGSNGSYSRELNEAVDRCLHLNWVEQTYDGKYGITDKGLGILEDNELFSGYGVDEEYQDEARNLIENFA